MHRLRPLAARLKSALFPTALAFLGVLFSPLAASAEEATSAASNKLLLDQLWVVVCAALVFFMQAGFLAFEMGSVRKKNAFVTAAKNVGDWVMVTLVFFFIGFGLMFGRSNGFIGSDLFSGTGIDNNPKGSPLGWSFFLFQLAFAGTAATIVSGAMAERVSFRAYLVYTCIMGGLIYPIFGHWVWGNGFYAGNKPWLASMNYVDFAGSSVVHLVGATGSIVGISMLGPRLGRYSSSGKVTPMDSHGMGWVCLGTLILWFGWWGFNGGSTLALNKDVPLVILNTSLAAAASGISGFTHCSLFQRHQYIGEKFNGAILGGLVAITACCHVVSPLGAVIIGLIAGVLHNITYDLVIVRWRLDDVVGAIPVHGFCGMLGILSVGIFGLQSKLPLPRFQQIQVQALGILVCVAWTAATSYIVFKVLQLTVGIRVAPMREIKGLQLDHEGDDETKELEALDQPIQLDEPLRNSIAPGVDR